MAHCAIPPHECVLLRRRHGGPEWRVHGSKPYCPPNAHEALRVRLKILELMTRLLTCRSYLLGALSNDTEMRNPIETDKSPSAFRFSADVRLGNWSNSRLTGQTCGWEARTNWMPAAS